MSDWRDEILEIIKNREGVFLAIDPQNVLALDQKLQTQIQLSGFDLLRYADPIEFRYHYEERKFQNCLNLIIIWNDTLDSAEKKLIWEILDYCQKNQSIIDCTASKIFPKLAANVIEQLDVLNYDVMYPEHQKLESDHNEIQTCEFVLHRVFEISSKIIANSPKTLFQSLLSIHYNSKKLTPILINYLMGFIDKNPDFDSWSPKLLLSDKSIFFDFIQLEWENLIENGNSKIDFSDKNIYSHLDNLFLEGYLNRIETQKMYPSWMKFGIKTENDESVKIQRLEESIKLFEKESQKLDSQSIWCDWQKTANQYSKLLAIADEQNHSIEELQNKINTQFENWIHNNYKNLWNMSPINGPIMVHHIFEYISRHYSDSKIALVIIDGLSITQWQIIKTILTEKNPELDFKDESIFAWIPTITSISRQSIFSGVDPSSFKDTLRTTHMERKHWQEKWQQDKKYGDVFYKTGYYFWDQKDLEDIPMTTAKVIGCVAMTVDEAMHNAKGGMKELNGMIRNWANDGILDQLFINLIKEGFEVFISSDHGNTEAIGIGEPTDTGVMEPGRRCRIYDNKDQLDRIRKEYKQSNEWWPGVFGPKYHFLLADEKYAFSKESEKVVTHGGLSFDEVMVPFVRVSKKIVK